MQEVTLCLVLPACHSTWLVLESGRARKGSCQVDVQKVPSLYLGQESDIMLSSGRARETETGVLSTCGHTSGLPREEMLENRENTHSRGFTNFELLMVMAVALILIGISSIGVVRMIDDAKERTALNQIAAVFRAARQAALTVNEERRVVLKVTYSGSATSWKEAYEDQPTLEFWVERKRRKNESWDVESNVSPPIDDVQRLPAGVFLVDVNGRSVIPANLTRADTNKDGTRSYRSYIIFNSKGVATHFYREDDGGVSRAEPILRNLALHFMFGTTEIDFSEIESPPKNIEYLLFIEDKRQVTSPAGELDALVSEIDRDIEFTGRTQAQTLYLIRLTGQSSIYDYGIYEPWPRSLLPEDFGEAG